MAGKLLPRKALAGKLSRVQSRPAPGANPGLTKGPLKIKVSA